jgi:hypothetical protein
VFDWLNLLARVGVDALLIVVLVAIVACAPEGPGAAASETAGDDNEPRLQAWRTDVVTLEADAVVVEASGRRFRMPQDARVTSDPGNATYRTLEMTWFEGGTEMRLNLYFAADETSWWVSEIRTYDGRPLGEWITYQGRFFHTPRGASFVGDIDLAGANARGPGRLVIDRMRLTAFAPGTGTEPFSGCRLIGPAGGGADPLEVGEPLGDQRIRGMEAAEAHELLQAQGVCHDFRLEWRYAGSSTSGYSQRWCVPPSGLVGEAAYGSEGQVILFVDDPVPRTFDPGTPLTVGC